ncbi:hypothetical protein J0K78_04085 [Halobacillus sp. GSS1]|uniref:hypothetical protein n=1 Tax=Halobacillus sp. GSS1 TaxID=2815919 RepID=UPI001A8C9513|nr:hypothetical protein [Halobacillus sp. GSS1]MBN9653437.1 hypothetical protein [Halobacillus sp. GSS1]
MKKFLEGTGITAFFYILVLIFGYFIDTRFLGEKMEVSGVFIGSLTMTIPYIMLGLFYGEVFKQKIKINKAFAIGVLIVLTERLSIYLIGFTYILRDIGPYAPTWAIGLPYFTTPYIILGGLVSLILYVSVLMIRTSIVRKEELA